MTKTTLISTFYSFQPFMAAAHAFSPTRIVLIVAEETIPKISTDISKVKELYGDVASIEILKVKGSDLLAIAKGTASLLEKTDGKLIANVSGGWKLLAQGVLYGCYARPQFVDKIVCNNLDDNSIVELPKLTFGLSSRKKELLHQISTRNGRPISKLAKEMGKTRGLVYQHLKELRELGFVGTNSEITMAGRIALI